MFSFLQIALITGLQTLRSPRGPPELGAADTRPGPAAGGLARAPHIAPGSAPRAAGQDCCREVSAKKEKHTAVNRGDPRARERACLRAAPGPGEGPEGGAAGRDLCPRRRAKIGFLFNVTCLLLVSLREGLWGRRAKHGGLRSWAQDSSSPPPPHSPQGSPGDGGARGRARYGAHGPASARPAECRWGVGGRPSGQSGVRAGPCPPASRKRGTPRAPPRGGKSPKAPRRRPGTGPGPTCSHPAGGRRRHAPGGHLLPAPRALAREGEAGGRVPAGRLTVSAENFCAGAGGSSPASRGSQQSCGSSMVTRAARGPVPALRAPDSTRRPPHPAALRVPCGSAGGCQITPELPGSSSRSLAPSLPPSLPPPAPPPRRRRRRAPLGSARLRARAGGRPGRGSAGAGGGDGPPGLRRQSVPRACRLPCARTCVHAHAHTCTHMHTRAHMRARVHTCAYMHTRVHTCTYAHTHA